MIVKCRNCGKMLDRNDAYKVILNNKNVYYCTEQEYLDKIKQNQIHRDMVDQVMSIFCEQVTNTILFKEITELENIYTSKLILDYLKENEDYIKNLINNKSFSSQYAKIRYFTAILKNNLADYRDNNTQYHDEEDFKDLEIEILEFRYKPKKKRRSIAEIEEGI